LASGVWRRQRGAVAYLAAVPLLRSDRVQRAPGRARPWVRDLPPRQHRTPDDRLRQPAAGRAPARAALAPAGWPPCDSARRLAFEVTLGAVVGNRLPRHGVRGVGPVRGTDPRVLVERAEADARDLALTRRAPEGAAAVRTERLRGAVVGRVPGSDEV